MDNFYYVYIPEENSSSANYFLFFFSKKVNKIIRIYQKHFSFNRVLLQTLFLVHVYRLFITPLYDHIILLVPPLISKVACVLHPAITSINNKLFRFDCDERWKKNILEMLFGFSEKKKEYIKIRRKKKRKWWYSQTFKVCFSEMENLIIFFNLFIFTLLLL